MGEFQRQFINIYLIFVSFLKQFYNIFIAKMKYEYKITIIDPFKIDPSGNKKVKKKIQRDFLVLLFSSSSSSSFFI